MRNLILVAAAAAMAIATPIAPAQAAPGGVAGGTWAQYVLPFCQEQVALNPSLKLGVCMSYFISSDTGYLTQFCHYLDDQGILAEDGITFDECVVYFHQG